MVQNFTLNAVLKYSRVRLVHMNWCFMHAKDFYWNAKCSFCDFYTFFSKPNRFSHQICSIKKLFLKILQYLHKNICVRCFPVNTAKFLRTPILKNIWGQLLLTKGVIESCQTSKLKHFSRIVNSFKPLTIFAKSSIVDVCQDSEYPSVKGFSMQGFFKDKKHKNETYFTRLIFSNIPGYRLFLKKILKMFFRNVTSNEIFRNMIFQ